MTPLLRGKGGMETGQDQLFWGLKRYDTMINLPFLP